ncbi:isochorismatase family protein [bacterium]|nr:isochorismatase family protein [bacterium]
MRHSDILSREGAVLLVCDVQKRCIKPIFGKERMINNIKTLISFCGMIGLPILLAELGPQLFGGTVEEIKNLVPRLDPIKRNKYSCFGNEDLTLRLEAMSTRTLVVVGMETHISIAQTVLDALTRGYHVHVVMDATSSRRRVDRRIALEKIRIAGAVVTTMEAVMYEISERIDIPQFDKFQELIGSIGK